MHGREYVEKGLENSLYTVCAVSSEEIIGIARIVGDGSICFYIQDIIVKPKYQGKGIGKALMQKVLNYINTNACEGAFIRLMSSKGKESFYEKFGFWTRPNEKFGSGMMKYEEEKE